MFNNIPSTIITVIDGNELMR